MSDPNTQNPLLLRAQIPGQTFSLPSGGIFYTHGELDSSAQNGEVVVSPMVTLDEIIMKTPDKVLNGAAIVEVFRRCIPQVLDPGRLLARDVDFLMICLRKVTYGNQIEMSYTHTCKDAKEHSYVVDIDPLIAHAKKIDAMNVERDYTLTLPNQQVVKLIPPRYDQMLRFYQSFDVEATQEEAHMRMIETTASLIESVDGITDRNHIMEWAMTIPAGFTKAIGNRVASVSTWGPELKSTVQCKDCKEEVEVEISLNPMHFFS